MDETDTIEMIQAAGLGQGAWLPALQAFAALSGSHRAQLIGFDGSGAVRFNWIDNVDPDMFLELEQAGGNDPRINSRIRVGLAAPILTVLDEADFQTEEDGRRHPAYGEHLRRWDAPYVCLTSLVSTSESRVGLSLNRRRSEGGLAADQTEQFRRVALHARQAVRTQAYLGQHAADVVAGALESIALTCFVCAADGRVLAMTRAAERLLIAGDRLQLRAGRLLPTGKGSALAAALMAARDRTLAPSRPIVLRDSAGLYPLALEVAPLPFARWPGAFDEAVLVMVREPTPRSTANPARVAASLFNFTPGETSVAAQLLSGQSVQEAAASLGIGPGTVRTHVRRLYEKTGATNQLKFAAILSALT